MLFIINEIESGEDRKKLEAIYKLYIKDILFVSYNILKDKFEAEDVAQNTIIKISENISKIEDVHSKKTRAFVIIIAKNLSRNIYRKRRQKRLMPMEEIKEEYLKCKNETPEEYILRLDNSEWIVKQLSNVKEEYAEILTLRYTYEYEIKEISSLLNINEGNVRTRIVRAKKALGKVIGGDCDEKIRNQSN